MSTSNSTPNRSNVNLTNTTDQLGRLFKMLPADIQAAQRAEFGNAVEALAIELSVPQNEITTTDEYAALIEDWCTVIAGFITADATADSRFNGVK